MTDPNRDELVKERSGRTRADIINALEHCYRVGAPSQMRCAIDETVVSDIIAELRAAEALSADTGGDDLREILAAQLMGNGHYAFADQVRSGINGAIPTIDALSAMKRVRRLAPTGWQLVPVEPTEAMWGGLARDIVMWDRFQKHGGSDLYGYLRSLGRMIPDWLTKEIPDTDQVPPKGTVAACIYKAMLETPPASPQAGEG